MTMPFLPQAGPIARRLLGKPSGLTEFYARLGEIITINSGDNPPTYDVDIGDSGVTVSDVRALNGIPLCAVGDFVWTIHIGVNFFVLGKLAGSGELAPTTIVNGGSWSATGITTTYQTLGSVLIPGRLKDEMWWLGYSLFANGGTGIPEAQLLYGGNTLAGSRLRFDSGSSASFCAPFLLASGVQANVSLQIRVTAGNTGQTFSDGNTNRLWAMRDSRY